MRLLRHLLRKPDGDGDSGGAEGAPPTASPPAAPSPPAPSPPAAGAPPAAPTPPAASPPAGSPPAAAPPPADGGDVKPAWREDWRETMAKGDAKVLTRLQRYASPEALSDALINAQNRISSGELKPVLKKDATPEQIAEWRAANGVPEAADKYAVANDPKLTPEAKAFLANYLPIAHAANLSDDQVKANLGFMASLDKAEKIARAEKDVELEGAGEELLREEWGGEYKRNITFIHNLLDGAATPEFKERLLGGRLADGTPIGSDPAALRFLMGLALVQNPTGTLVPGFNNNPAQGVDEEIAKIDKVMREDRASYNRDEKMQARYRELLVAKEKLKPRG